MFDRPVATAVASAAGAGEKKDGDKKPRAEDTNPILHRIQEAILQVLCFHSSRVPKFPRFVCTICNLNLTTRRQTRPPLKGAGHPSHLQDLYLICFTALYVFFLFILRIQDLVRIPPGSRGETSFRAEDRTIRTRMCYILLVPVA